MKCCSLKRKDLNFHFKKMSHKYYMLNGLNDETLRQVYINSLPDELQAEIHRHMASTRRDLRNTSLGEIHQIKLFSNMLKDKAKFDKASLSPRLHPGLARLFMWKKDLKKSEEKRDLLLTTSP
ncbi:hypothetical protein ACOSP7_027178 [Xanthoceras sorbifolium]